MIAAPAAPPSTALSTFLSACALSTLLFLLTSDVLGLIHPTPLPAAQGSGTNSGSSNAGVSSSDATDDSYVTGPVPPMSAQEVWEAREHAREMFYHGYDSYMKHGYPWDELKPLSCVGRRWDMRERGTLDDSLGGYALTLVDSLDMLAVVGDYAEFRRAVALVLRDVSFDKDVTVSVFEATIRVMGGLLSAHMLAADPAYDLMPGYSGELLDMAYELGWRLLPAFNTSTGEPVFERLSRRALQSLWDRRSYLNLMGTNIDVQTGVWINPFGGVGAGVDSFFEYLLKSYVALGDSDLLRMFVTARKAVDEFLSHKNVHIETHMQTGFGALRGQYVSALQSFWPGLEVLAGSPLNATRQIRPLLQLWRRYEAMPEMFDIPTMAPIHYAKDSPLRPELVESLYHLYSVTRHPSLLAAGREIADAIEKHSRVRCGYASIADVTTKRLDDRMDSYFLSETTKYLFLLFDAALMPHGHLELYPNASRPVHAGSTCAAIRGGSPRTGAGGEENTSVRVAKNATLAATSREQQRIRGRNADSASAAAADDSADGDVAAGIGCFDSTGSTQAAAAGAPLCSGDTGASVDYTVGFGSSGIMFPQLSDCSNSASTILTAGAALPSAESDSATAPADHHDRPVFNPRHWLACAVRNNRTVVPALPFSNLHALFTTEGHLLLLRSAALSLYPTFHWEHPHQRRHRKKPFQRAPASGSSAADGSTSAPSSPSPTAAVEAHAGSDPHAHAHTGELRQATCLLPVHGWKDVFAPAPRRPASPRVELTEVLTTCLAPEGVVHHAAHAPVDAGDSDTSACSYPAPASDPAPPSLLHLPVWDVSSVSLAGELLLPAAISSIDRQRAMSQLLQGDATKAADPTVVRSEVDVMLNPELQSFVAGKWTQGGPFSELALQDALNTELSTLVRAGVVKVTMGCVGESCGASISLAPNPSGDAATAAGRLRVRVVSDEVYLYGQGVAPAPLRWTFDGCGAAFGGSPGRTDRSDWQPLAAKVPGEVREDTFDEADAESEPESESESESEPELGSGSEHLLASDPNSMTGKQGNLGAAPVSSASATATTGSDSPQAGEDAGLSLAHTAAESVSAHMAGALASISGVLALAHPLSACSPIDLRVLPEEVASESDVGTGSDAYPREHPTSGTGDSGAGAHPRLIAIVGRGQCSFVTKARNAQAAGAIAVMVVDFGSSESERPGTSMSPLSFQLADDDTGGDVSAVVTGIKATAAPVTGNGPAMAFACAIGLARKCCRGSAGSAGSSCADEVEDRTSWTKAQADSASDAAAHPSPQQQQGQPSSGLAHDHQPKPSPPATACGCDAVVREARSEAASAYPNGALYLPRTIVELVSLSPETAAATAPSIPYPVSPAQAMMAVSAALSRLKP